MAKRILNVLKRVLPEPQFMPWGFIGIVVVLLVVLGSVPFYMMNNVSIDAEEMEKVRKMSQEVPYIKEMAKDAFEDGKIVPNEFFKMEHVYNRHISEKVKKELEGESDETAR